MDWMQISVLTTTLGADIVSEQLMQAGSRGVMIEDRNDVRLGQRPEGQWDIIDESVAEAFGEDVRVTGYYAADDRDALSEVRSRIRALKDMGLGIDLGKLEVLESRVDEEDWASSWKKDVQPFRLGKHMLIKPSWTQAEVLPGDRIIEIDPGMAFGTGTHETTGMCVELIEQYVKPGDRVIDVGTGTGILAIAACHMGAGRCLAIDIDPVAVRVASENVRRNGMQGRIETRQGDLLEAVGEAFEVVVANIIADVICLLASPARAHIADGGLFICSGIARERQRQVIDALNSAGYRELDIRNQGEWTAIACRK